MRKPAIPLEGRAGQALTLQAGLTLERPATTRVFTLFIGQRAYSSGPFHRAAPAMIVKCEQCQTKFKIPDERVTDKGVKVRCTKCQHMFRVTRDMAQPAPGAAPAAAAAAPPRAPVPPPPPPAAFAPPAPEADPFAQFGAPSDATANEKTREGVFALGVEASRVPELPLSPPTPIKNTAVSSAQAFDFSTLAPTVPAPSVPPAAAPKVVKVPTSSMPVAKVPTSSMPVAKPVPATSASSSAPFDFAGLSAAPSPPSPRASPGPSPFDFSALGPAPSPSAGGAFDFGTLGPATTLPPPPGPSSPTATRAPPAFDFSALAPSAPPPAPATKAPAFEPSFASGPAPAQPTGGALFADVPDLNEPMPGSSSTMQPPNVPDDFFGTPLSPPPTALTPGNKPGTYRGGGGTKEELFEMPHPEDGPAPTSAEKWEPTLPDAPPLAPVVPVAKSLEVRVANLDTGSSSGRGALGTVVNFGIAIVLVAALIVVGSALLNDGKLDASTFSPARLKTLFARETDYEASDISNGLYDTLRGKPVFFVRGEVTNNSPSATRVLIRAEILDGETMVRAAEVVAGSPPTPEQLRNLTGAEEVERLLTLVSKSAPSLAPGESAPFLVTFFEYPPDLKAFRVRVSARADQGETAAR